MKQIEAYFPHDLLLRQGVTVDDAELSLWRAVDRFLLDLSSVDEERLHVPLSEGGWSPAQYADHLYRVTLLYVAGVEQAMRGEAPAEFERGWVTASGGLISPPGGEPVAGREPAVLERDLRAGTSTLIDTVRHAVAGGAAERVAHVNPYFGPLTPLGCLQMAAVHAVHHVRKHLSLALA